MSTFRNPVGPQSSRVYWRRRLVVVLGLVAVIAIIVLIFVRPPAGEPVADPKGSKTPSGTASSGTPSGSSTNPADAVPCDPTKVSIEASSDAAGYDPGVTPMLTFSLKSLMTVPCTISAGSDVQEFKITSGSDLIWSSKDCQSDEVAATVLLQPGIPIAGTPIAWDRTRSSASTCEVARDQVAAGGASYHLIVTVGELEPSNDWQFLLY